MKKFIIKLFTVIVMIALGATVVTGAFSNPRAGVVFVEEEIHGNKTGAKDNANFNDKSELVLYLGFPAPAVTVAAFTGHIYLLASAYRTLPEMPPDLA